ncbi:MAG TPA: ATP-grasp domain-containing protein [Terriglobales bacterium]|nr:ATP-grasp domain-containing protein [Terriglobales bacterium]
MSSTSKPRVLLLCTTTGYQAQAFVDAAEKLGLEVVFGTDRCHVLDDPWGDDAIPLRFENPEENTRKIVEAAGERPFAAIIQIGDRATETAALASKALGLLNHPPEAAEVCRDKYLARGRLRQAGLNVPDYRRFALDADPRQLLAAGAVTMDVPRVLKPLALSASRGVIRADTPEEFVRAFERIRTLLESPEVGVLREETSKFIQVETYIEGAEIAVEANVDRGRLRVLAIFDKPDPLAGPFFEETIYVTPSRMSREAQQGIGETLGKAAAALGLYHGPAHAELRLNPSGIWVMEVAARSIGGLCSRALRFEIPLVDKEVSLEELLIRLMLGLDVSRIYREDVASGVMMIPIPEAGFYQETQGIDEARAVDGVEDIVITAKESQKLVPLPEGASYLGFIFARGESPEFVENALRRAHEKLRFVISTALPVI